MRTLAADRRLITVSLATTRRSNKFVDFRQCLRAFNSSGNGRIADSGFALLGCIDYERQIVADRFVALPAQCVADKCAVFGRPPVRRMRYLRACPAVTRFAIVFTGRPLSKNHGCCRDAAGFNAPKSWAGVFHVEPTTKKGGLPCSASGQTPRIKPIRPR
jgi:hypothetical protein